MADICPICHNEIPDCECLLPSDFWEQEEWNKEVEEGGEEENG